jgi:hypothetical protein
MKSLCSILVLATTLVGCNAALGLDSEKSGPDPNAADSGATEGGAESSTPPSVDGGPGDAGPGASEGGACGGQTCGTSEQCDNGQWCPVAPGGGSCVVFPSCGCSATENCARINGAPEACVQGGSVAALGNCDDVTNCRPGLLCADYVCNPPCDGTCATANYQCVPQSRSLADGGAQALGYSVCEPHCNPVTLTPQTGDATHAACGTGQRCNASSTGNGTTYCTYGPGTGAQGAACTSRPDCAAGYDCVFPKTGGGRCERYCDYGGTTDCPTGTTCQALLTALYDGKQQIGVCQ